MPMKKEFSFGTLMGAAYDHDDEGTADISNVGVIAVMAKVEETFPGAITSRSLAVQLNEILTKKGYTKETLLLATSVCGDEVNRDLEDELQIMFGNNYSMGGLAGFAFGGATAFGSMAHHMPSGGSCLVVYGPHVGIDWDGTVGKVNRRGHHGSGACCGPANAALEYVRAVRSGERGEAETPDDFIDAQETWVMKTLLAHGERLEKAANPSAELPLVLFDIQDELMKRIVVKSSGEVAGDGKIALVGGIQINTPEGTPEYFLPKKFELVNNKGAVLEDLLGELHSTQMPMFKKHLEGRKTYG